MSLQWLRQLSLVVSNSDGKGLDFGKFWCTFSVKRGDQQTPNTLDARIYNLNDTTAKKLQSYEFTQVTLGAGYNPNGATSYVPPLVFKGTIFQTRGGRVSQLDSYVDITAADGDEAYNFAPIFYSVPAGSSSQPNQIAAQIISAMNSHSPNQTIVNAPVQPNIPTTNLVRGRVLYGMARDEARDFAWQNNVKWSLQDGAFTLIPYTSYIPAGSIPLISAKTGLIGTPEQTQQGINIRTLLNPLLKIGQLVKLDATVNQFRAGLDLPALANNGGIDPITGQPFGVYGQSKLNANGLYYVMCANHTGDTREQSWYTDLTCLAVDASLANNDTDALNALFKTADAPINRWGQP